MFPVHQKESFYWSLQVLGETPPCLVRSPVRGCILEQRGLQAVRNQRGLDLPECTKEVYNKCEVFDLSSQAS